MQCHLLLLCTHSEMSRCNLPLSNAKEQRQLFPGSPAINLLWDRKYFSMAKQRSLCVPSVTVACNQAVLSALAVREGEPLPIAACCAAHRLPARSKFAWMISQLTNNNVLLWKPELKLVWVSKKCFWFLSNVPVPTVTQLWTCSLLLP